MSIVNKKLYNTFLLACETEKRKPVFRRNNISLYFDNGNYIILWTPLNKLTLPINPLELDEKTIRDMLDEINNAVEDYHIELSARDLDANCTISNAAYYSKIADRVENNPCVGEWLKLFRYVENEEQIQKDAFMFKIAWHN